MYILGITALISENTAACLLNDSEIIGFVEEERFNGIKHAPRMVPKRAISYLLEQARINIDQVDYIAIGFDPVFRSSAQNFLANLKEGNWERMFREQGAFAEYFVNSVRLKDFLKGLSNSGKTRSLNKKFVYVPHHQSHASSAVRCSGFDESIVISVDGVGEDNAGLIGYFRNGKITKLKTIGINQSLGWLYSEATAICGFKSHSHEGKLMGLAAYGKPDLDLLHGVARLTDDGYHLEKNFFNTMKMRIQVRKQNEPLTQKYKDLAATVQNFLEEAVIRIAKSVHKATGIRKICLAGGVSLNCDMNAKLIGLDIFDDIFIQPAANDAGTALGAALEVYSEKTGGKNPKMINAYHGPRFSDSDIESILMESKLKYKKISGLDEVAQLLAEGKTVGWFSGRIECGPRALGGRSILAHPGMPNIKDKINAEIKHREMWRPFAPSVMKEYAHEYFENYYSSPFMLLTFDVKKEKQKDIIASVHIDGTARVQEVTADANPRYYSLIEEFRKITGIPVLLNTSLNDKDKPICLAPRDAIQTFFTTGLDVLVMEDFILTK